MFCAPTAKVADGNSERSPETQKFRPSVFTYPYGFELEGGSMLAETNLPDDSFKTSMYVSCSRQVTGSDELRFLFADVGQCSPRVMRGSPARVTPFGRTTIAGAQ